MTVKRKNKIERAEIRTTFPEKGEGVGNIYKLKEGYNL
jgi:hypothetical protein